MAASSTNPTHHMNGDIYTNAFRHCNNIRNQLTSTIQDYIDASISLEAICAMPPLGRSSRSSLEQVLTGIDSHLPSLAADEDRIRQARCALTSTRNKSQSLVPINVLPIDVLYHIFDFASQHCRRPPRIFDDERSLTLAPQDMIVAVSTARRQASLRHYSLWSHLDLILCGSKTSQHLARVRLQIKRSQTAPLYIHIVADNHGTMLDDLEILGLLMPLKPPMRQLEVEVDVHHRNSRGIMTNVLNAWLDDSTLGATKLLRLTRISNKWPASDRLNDFLFSLRTLVLGAPTFRGIVSRFKIFSTCVLVTRLILVFIALHSHKF